MTAAAVKTHTGLHFVRFSSTEHVLAKPDLPLKWNPCREILKQEGHCLQHRTVFFTHFLFTNNT